MVKSNSTRLQGGRKPYGYVCETTGAIVFVWQVTFCFVQAIDEDNHMIVKMFGIIIQVLASKGHW